ncbi:hypothetical protein [Candidatus Palauibacter sp.]|uniref:hypothetical protein n=1 Tax=Candidatus Palauibacter sp. TaxID=3101350 RepID=UPI003AF3190D
MPARRHTTRVWSTVQPGRPARTLVLSALAGIGAAGCDSGGDSDTDDTPPAETDSTQAAAGAPRAAGEIEPPTALLPGEGPIREYRVLLVNPLDDDAYIFASAGAAHVALDTVPRRDSVRVDIRVRADIVRFEARDSSGVLLLRADLALDREALNRWVIEPDSTDRDEAVPASSPSTAARPKRHQRAAAFVILIRDPIF